MKKNVITNRNLIAALAFAGIQAVTLSSAQAGGWYTESSIFQSDVDDTSLTSTGRDVEAELDEDIGFSTAIGYKFKGHSLGAVRVDLEYISTDNDNDEIDFNGNIFTGDAVGGSIETDSLFLNVIQEFKTGTAYVPYVGVGIGFVNVDSDISYGPVANITDDDTVFGYNFVVGLDVKLSKKFTGFVEYRYLETNDVDLDRFGGGPGGLLETSQSGDIQIDTIGVGLRYSF